MMDSEDKKHPTAAEKFLARLGEQLDGYNQKLYKFHKAFFDEYYNLIQSLRSDAAEELILIQEGKYIKKKLSRIHCVRTNSQTCEIELANGDIVKFPANSFVCGALYPISFKKVIKLGGAHFIGYVSK